MRTVILTADNLGVDIAANRAIFEGYHAGNITAASILANGESFEDAAENTVQNCTNLDIGIQLNITEGKSLITDYESYLTANDGYYNNSGEKLLLFSNNKKYLEQIEAEFCSQIDRVLAKGITPVYLTSNHNIHAIPKIFDIVCRLAVKYKIPNVRTQTELPYFVPELYRHAESKYLSNIFQNCVLNTATWINQRTVNKYEINTNNYFIGVLYSGQMDKCAILNGIRQLPDETVTEIVFHPTTNKWKHLNYLEYKTLIEPELKQEIEGSGIKLQYWRDVSNNNNVEKEENTTEDYSKTTINESPPFSAEKQAETPKYETVVHSIKVAETDGLGTDKTAK